jgi:antitoxin component of MazEF toxin-antitoxin module
METIVKTKKWGNSVGIVLPSDLIKEEKIKPGDQVILSIEKKHNVLKELFGALQFKKSTDQLLKESREMESKWI